MAIFVVAAAAAASLPGASEKQKVTVGKGLSRHFAKHTIYRRVEL